MERHRDDVIVVAIFVAARIVFIVACGVRMDLQFLGFAPHLPDLGLLQHHLVQTLFYEHTQPPGYPLLVGLVLKLSPFPDGISFQILYLCFGVALVLVLRRIAQMIGLGRAATFAAIFLVVTNPALTSIEFQASYDEPTILLIAVMVLAIGRYASSASVRHLTWAATAAGAIVLTRSVFHPVWYLAFVAGVFLLRRPAIDWRRLAIVLGAPAIVILAFLAKNEAVYHELTLTTWEGPSLDKIAGSAARPAERSQSMADGTVSHLFGLPIFFPYSEYEHLMPPCRPKHRNIPVLAEELRPTNGSPNLDYECFLPIYRQQGKDARAYIRKRPIRFLGAELTGAQMFFEPPLTIIFTPKNHAHLQAAETAYAWTLFPKVSLKPLAYSEFSSLRVLAFGGIRFQPTALLLDVVAMVVGLGQIPKLVRQREREGGGLRRSGVAAWAAIGLTCVWVTGIGSFFEINENARYRLLIEPYLLVTLAWLGERAVAWARGRCGSTGVGVDVDAEVEHGG